MKSLKKYWAFWLICLIQIICITLDAKQIVDWQWYYVYAPLLFLGVAFILIPYIVLLVHYYNSKNI